MFGPGVRAMPSSTRATPPTADRVITGQPPDSSSGAWYPGVGMRPLQWTTGASTAPASPTAGYGLAVRHIHARCPAALLGPLGDAVHRSASGQPLTRQDPRTRRTGQAG